MTVPARPRHLATITTPGREHDLMPDLTDRTGPALPSWAEAIAETCEPRTASSTAGLAQLLARDEDAPTALRAIARAYLDQPLYRSRRPRARAEDPGTSQDAARRVSAAVRGPGGKVHRILATYAALAGPRTAREVAESYQIAGAWKRVSELLADGLLRVVLDDEGRELVRDGGRVLEITPDGRRELARLDAIRRE